MRSQSLKFSWIILPLLLVALTTHVLILDLGASSEAVRDFAERQRDVLRSTVYGIKEAFRFLHNDLNILAHPEVARGPDELESAMAAIYEQSRLHGYRSFLFIAFYGDDGTSFYFPNRPSGEGGAAFLNEADGLFRTDEGFAGGIARSARFVATLSVRVEAGGLGGRIVGYFDLSGALKGYLAQKATGGVTRYVLDETGAIIAGPRGTEGNFADYARPADPRYTLFRLFLADRYSGVVRFGLKNATEAVGIGVGFELPTDRLFLVSVGDYRGVTARARGAQRPYWLLFGGFFVVLVIGGVLYWRYQIKRIEREAERGITEARELEARGLASIREINQALLEELELGKLLDTLAKNVSEALNLAGLQVVTLAGDGADRGSKGYRLATSYFSPDTEAAVAKLVRKERRSRGRKRGDAEDANPIFGGGVMDGLVEDIVERTGRTGGSLRVSRDGGERGRFQSVWIKAWGRVEGLGIAEFVVCPLVSKDHPEGLAVFLPRRAGIPLELYETFAGNLAQAIQGARNIERQRKTLDELDQAYGRLQAFYRIGAEIVVQKNFLKIGQRIVDAITTYSNFSRAVLSLVEGEGLRRMAFSNLTNKEVAELLARKPFSLVDLERIKENARKISRSYYLPAPMAERTIGDQGIASTRRATDFIDWDPNDFFFVPLEGLDGELLGVISVDDPKDGLAPTEGTIQPLESFAHLAAQALTVSRLRWELERSQNDYRNLFRDATDALFVLDEELKVVASNRQFSSLVGKPEDDIHGAYFVDFAAVDWHGAVKRAFERVLSNLGRQELEFHLLSRRSGERIVAMSVEAKAFIARVSHTDGGTGELSASMDPKTDLDLAHEGGYIRYQGSLRDITGAKESERELLRRQEQLKIINTLGRLALSSFDLEPLFTETAQAIQGSLGYDNVALFMMDSGSDELVLEAQSGIFDVLVGRGYRIYAHEGVVGWTARSGVTRYVPDTSKDPHFVMPAGIFEIGAELAIPLLVEGEVKGVLDLETQQTNAFDPADISALETIADQLSQAIHNIKLYQELRERALALALANEELLKVDKMKSDFVSMVSHELNTPVTVIKGYAQLMAGRIIGEVNEKQQDILETIIEKSDHLGHLIVELLDLLKIETGQYVPELQKANLTKVLEEFFSEQSKYLDTPRMSLVLDLPKQPIVLEVDLPKIKTVFSHLLSNANKFTIGEGTVTISAEEDEDSYRFTVADTGIGIPEVEFERIFERLYQVDSTLTRHYGGTGLGLAVTRAIVERHQGRIWVQSELGEGSRFVFTLPKTTESPGAG
jgi:PAS domain S-box-containing protein